MARARMAVVVALGLLGAMPNVHRPLPKPEIHLGAWARLLPLYAVQVVDESRISVSYFAGPRTCTRETVTSREAATTIVVTVRSEFVARAQPCHLMARLTSTDIVLDAPIGDRKVVDGSTV